INITELSTGELFHQAAILFRPVGPPDLTLSLDRQSKDCQRACACAVGIWPDFDFHPLSGLALKVTVDALRSIDVLILHGDQVFAVFYSRARKIQRGRGKP